MLEKEMSPILVNVDDPRLDCTTPLTPGNAVASIILVGTRYLLQLRDNKNGIFFPGHWGCFGGASKLGETPTETLTRELQEELGVNVAATQLQYFSRFDFDLQCSGRSLIWRYFYEIELGEETLPTLRLGEGSAMQLFAAEAILKGAVPFTPYDAFALWLHINKGRLRA